MCRGRGARRGLYQVVQCIDCGGTGRVNHCVACAGRGKLWLGGDEYIDCPVCPSMNGGAAPVRVHVVMSGIQFQPTPIGARNG